MAAPAGFDIINRTATVTLPITVGATLLSVPVPARFTVGGVDLIASALDVAGSPLLALNVGDAVDEDRFLAASIVGRAGGTEEYRAETGAYWRYAAASAINVKVQTAPVTGAGGAVSLAVYGYPSVAYTDLRTMVLREVGVLTEGTTALAEDDALTQEALTEVHETLRGRDLANKQDMTWTIDAVPVFASRPYAVMAAWRLCSVFGVPARREQSLAVKAAEAEREMRRQVRKPYDGEPVSLEPYTEQDAFRVQVGVLT